MSFATVITEGNLVPADLLERIAVGEAEGQQPADFGLAKSHRLTDEIAAAWNDARNYWKAFQSRLRHRPQDDPATSETRENWVVPLLELLGYKLTYVREAEIINGRSYAISHRAGEDTDGPPIHIEGYRRSIDKKTTPGRQRISPHAMLQEYLNATDRHLWGLVTNGQQIRLLRDSSRMTRPTFVEFNLQDMLEGEKFSEFALFYRLLHRTRLPQKGEDGPSSLLERYHQQGIEAGGRVREGLRIGVAQALDILGNGLLQHPKSSQLREALASGKLDAVGYYRQLLRLIYRLLFLMVAEERKLVGGEPSGLEVYNDFYGVTRLRQAAGESFQRRERYSDLWQGLLTTFRLLEDDTGAATMGIAALDGDLFGPEAIPDLEEAKLYNTDFLQAISALSLYNDAQTKSRRRVNYAALDVEELGSVYENLLERRPIVLMESKYVPFSFKLTAGAERKTSASHFTNPELVLEAVANVLDPVLVERLAAAGPGQAAREKAILDITVCDPACGSGHFLLAAARRLGRELALVRSGEEQPGPEWFRPAVRDVIAKCIYGVDSNPFAVDLCKLALWLEGFCTGLPLCYLDSHIRWGNSLVGTHRDLVEAGIPDEAYQAITGDNKAVASAFKKRNQEQRKLYIKHGATQDRMLFAEEAAVESAYEEVVQRAKQVESLPYNSVSQIRAKKAEFDSLRGQGSAWWEQALRHHLWTAAFFLSFTDAHNPAIPTSQWLFQSQNRDRRMEYKALELANEMGFFHWELEFSHVFEHGGFDVVLGNPPWERIKLQEEEHWIDDQYISKASNKAERNHRILEYRASSDQIKRDRIAKFDTAKYRAEAESRFIRASGRFPLTAVGDVNTYALFTEHARRLLNPYGRAGVIVPTGIATDDTTKAFFGDLIKEESLAHLTGFENEAFIFPGVHHAFKFCILTILGSKLKVRETDFVFLCRRFEDVPQQERHFVLNRDDLALINPNTGTCPIFRTRTDAELTKKIYRAVPVLLNERTGENPWGVSFMAMLHMANDSHLFQNEAESGWGPLYEAKMLHQFTHRWATYEGVKKEELQKGLARSLTFDELNSPEYTLRPRYWVSNSEVEARLATKWNRKWLLAFRDITSSVVERTVIFSFLPRVAVGHTSPLLFLKNTTDPRLAMCFVASVNSLTLDYTARQKIGGTHLTFGLLNQLPVLSPTKFSEEDVAYLSERVLELVYTAYDMQPFAMDVWADMDEVSRARVLARWQDCNSVKLSEFKVQNDPPTPFSWNEERRAHIRAELDAHIARLYGLTRDELRYILDPTDVYGPNFPSETFRVLKEKEIRQFGEYRTRRLVLAAWDAKNDNLTR